MALTEDIATWLGESVLTEGGDQVGVVDSIYLDEDTSDPEWVAVRLSDGQDRLVPIIAITPNGDRLCVTFAADVIASSPVVQTADGIDPDEEHQLYAHYGQVGVQDLLEDTGTSGAPPAQIKSTHRFRKLGS